MKKFFSIRRHTRKSAGVAMIEFAIAVPILILLLAILFECGRLYYVYMRFTEIAWEGARFFSSLNDPPSACKGIATTNLPYTDPDYYDSLSSSGKADFLFHKTVQDRVLSMFSYNPASWPLESDDLVPAAPSKPQKTVKDNPTFYNMPTIITQYVNNSLNCPSPIAGPTASVDYYNTVTVCLKATYLGFFFNVPLHICSTSHLLEANESLRIPTQPVTGWGGSGASNGGFGPGPGGTGGAGGAGGTGGTGGTGG